MEIYCIGHLMYKYIQLAGGDCIFNTLAIAIYTLQVQVPFTDIALYTLHVLYFTAFTVV